MPVVRFEIAELERLLRKRVPREELALTIPMLGADVEDSKGDTWAVEFFPDRPDLFTVEGVARALRAWYGVEPGLKRYEVRKGAHTVTVEPGVEKVRPFIAAAFVRGVPVTDARLTALIELQEDLHWGLGARRRKVAIGIHDAEALAPPFVYTTVKRDGLRFVPLQDTREMSPAEILEQHPKGRDYAHLLEGHSEYPVILDAKKGVVSMPPIINAARTTVTTATRDLFVDVTGMEEWAVERALNLIVCALAEAGGAVESVEIVRGGKRRTTPDLAPESRDLSVAEANRLLGTTFSDEEIARQLQRLGHGAAPKGATVAVEVPAYRVDVLHPWDLIEDVAIGHGLNNFQGVPTRAATTGSPLAENLLAERARQSLVGLGFLETLGLTLSNERDQFERMRRPETPTVKVKNPVTEEVTLLRPTLLPNLLGVLKKNAHRDLPQRVFEVGMVCRLEAGEPVYERRVAGALIAGRSNFSEIKGVALALARDLGWPGVDDVVKLDDPAFLSGRAAAFASVPGVFGEVHPEVLEGFGLAHPVTAFEFRLAEGPAADRVRGKGV